MKEELRLAKQALDEADDKFRVGYEEYKAGEAEVLAAARELEEAEESLVKARKELEDGWREYKEAAVEANKRLEEAFNNQEVLKAAVAQVLDGGLSVVVEDVRIFIPASLVSETYERRNRRSRTLRQDYQ